MTARTLFIIALKVLGLYLIVETLTVIPELTYLLAPSEMINGISSLFVVILTIFIFISVIGFLLFKPGKIVDMLNLDKGFDQENILFDVSSTSVLTIAIIVIAGYMIIHELPLLFNQVCSYIEIKTDPYLRSNSKISNGIILSASRIVVGLLLIGYQKQIVHFIENRKAKQ